MRLVDLFADLPPKTRFMVILAVACGMMLFTGNKLHTLAQARGWLPGARTETHAITQMAILDGKYGESYWVSWTNTSIRTQGDHRTNLQYDDWATLRIGDPIEITFVGKSSTPYLKNDIDTSNGNFIFDGVLLALELGVSLLMIYKLLMLRRQPPEAPPANPFIRV